MLNEDKMKLMTGIAMFEKKEGKSIFPANRYFRSDYISSRMLRSFFSYTCCYILCVMVWILYSMERLLNAMNLDEIILAAKMAGIGYVAGLVLYLMITFFVYRRRYEYARRGMKVYVAKLKRLEKRYEFQSRTKELTKEGGRYDDVSRA
ncbi:MAG: hypothetical protein PHV18_03180 [Lachnospiraceae bacterium]|nr:hypothetical protein [Lachnospiraceae bacterium]